MTRSEDDRVEAMETASPTTASPAMLARNAQICSRALRATSKGPLPQASAIYRDAPRVGWNG